MAEPDDTEDRRPDEIDPVLAALYAEVRQAADDGIPVRIERIPAMAPFPDLPNRFLDQHVELRYDSDAVVAGRLTGLGYQLGEDGTPELSIDIDLGHEEVHVTGDGLVSIDTLDADDGYFNVWRRQP